MVMNRRSVLMGLCTSAPFLAGSFSLSTAYALSGDAETCYPHIVKRHPPASLDGRMVISHWHVFPISIDNKPAVHDYYTKQYLSPTGELGKHAATGGYLRDRPIPRPPIELLEWKTADAKADIRFAIEAGVDAFQYNIGSFNPSSPAMQYIFPLLQAIKEEGFPFKIIACLDCKGLDKNIDTKQICENLKHILVHDSSMKYSDGRPVLSCFYAEYWSPDRWRSLLADLASEGVKVYFAPMFLSSSIPTGEYLELLDMIGWWAGNHPLGIRSVELAARKARNLGKKVMWPVWTQDCRAKSGWYAEARNSAVFRDGWESALSFGADCVNVLTWNDYSEASSLRPSVGTQFAFADLNRFYSDWYKSSTQPRIVNDALYYFHRRDFTGADRSLVPGRAPMMMKLGMGPADDVEIVAFLKEPASVEILNEGGRYEFIVGKQLSSLRAPLAPGRQSFLIRRNGATVLALESATPVRSAWDWQDLTYRGGSSTRPPVYGKI